MSSGDANPDPPGEPGKGNHDDCRDTGEHGRRRDSDLPPGTKPRRRARKPSPPLWRPADDPRDVNLEMTADDLDRSAASRPQRTGSRRPVAPRPKGEIEFPDQPGLGRSLREQFMRPAK